VDVVCGGKLYRFDINHPETRGMIECFIRSPDGIRTRIGFDELASYRGVKGIGFRTRPPGVVDGNAWLCSIHPVCRFWMVKPDIADGKIGP
jgi:5-methyltetrahydropteroyltriglutamate--homocysteine methyltransferase